MVLEVCSFSGSAVLGTGFLNLLRRSLVNSYIHPKLEACVCRQGIASCCDIQLTLVQRRHIVCGKKEGVVFSSNIWPLLP